MAKLDSIVDFSIVLNKGYASNAECQYFDTVNHAQLIDVFINYVNLNKDIIGLTRIENRQSIADSGCDVFVELKGGVKIGVQIKSKGDVADANFSNKVKAQYAESFALGLDKFYILICSPIDTSAERKINYIVSNIATYKTNYHAVLNPNNCVRIFNPGGAVSEDEFTLLKQLYSKEDNPLNTQSVVDLIKNSLSQSPKEESEFSAKVERAINRTPFQGVSSARAFLDFMDLDVEIDETMVISSINDIIRRIGTLSPELRKLYFLIVKESIDAENFVDALEINLHELQSIISESKQALLSKLRVLNSAKYKLITLDDDTPDIAQLFLYLPGDCNFMKLLRDFSEANKVNLQDIIVLGDFSSLD